MSAQPQPQDGMSRVSREVADLEDEVSAASSALAEFARTTQTASRAQGDVAKGARGRGFLAEAGLAAMGFSTPRSVGVATAQGLGLDPTGVAGRAAGSVAGLGAKTLRNGVFDTVSGALTTAFSTGASAGASAASAFAQASSVLGLNAAVVDPQQATASRVASIAANVARLGGSLSDDQLRQLTRTLGEQELRADKAQRAARRVATEEVGYFAEGTLLGRAISRLGLSGR